MTTFCQCRYTDTKRYERISRGMDVVLSAELEYFCSVKKSSLYLKNKLSS